MVRAIGANLVKGLFLAVSLPWARGQSMNCANNAGTQSKVVRGPAGATAVLKVHSQDDHSKNSHDCMADYSLQISPADSTNTGRFLSSDGDWGRRLLVHLDGFSRDGKHVFGTISEGGKYSFVNVIDYDRTAHHVDLISIQQGQMHLRAAKCGTSFAVAGSTNAGAIVLQPNTANRCRGDHHWLLDRTGTLRKLAQDEPLLSLYTR